MLQLRREKFDKNLPVGGPTARTRRVENRTAPARVTGGAMDIIPDGFDQRHNSSRLEMADSSGERWFARTTGRAARVCVEMVDGACTRVNQIAARALKILEEGVIRDCGIDHAEGIANGAI